jgi:UDP-glucuronate 4-epimerase
MKVLVTGGAGFVGSHLVQALLAQGDDVSVIDDFNDFYNPIVKRKNLEEVRQLIRLYEGDICDKRAVLDTISLEKPDAIVHLAARAGVRPSVQYPELYLQTNVIGTFNVLEAARQCGVERLAFASSSSVYGALQEVPFREDQALTQTLSPYAASKIAGEHLCSNYSHLYGLRVVCLRLFTVYGPRQRPDLSIHKFTNLIFHAKPIEVYGDGTARRDFTYIDDTVQGIIASLAYDGSAFEVFNLGESQTVELRTVIHKIEQVLGRKAKIQFQPPIPGDMPQTFADISKARKLLNYHPNTTVEIGIPKFVDWYLTSRNR